MRDVVQGAYTRLALLPLGQNLDADRASAGLTVLNDMVASWVAEGVVAGPFAPLGLSDTFPLDAMYVQGVKAMLALQLASESGLEAAPAVQREAKRGWAALLAAYVTSPAADQDDGLTSMPSLRRYGLR